MRLAALACVATLYGCHNNSTSAHAAENGAAIVSVTPAAPTLVILKCDGLENSTMYAKNASIPSAKRALYGFRIDPVNRHIQEWKDGVFLPVCNKEPCLEVSPRQFSVKENFNEKRQPSGTRMGLNILDFDRTTGALKTNRLVREGSGVGEEDLVYAIQSSFVGTCAPVDSTNAFNPKF